MKNLVNDIGTFLQTNDVSDNKIIQNAFSMFLRGDTDGLQKLAENVYRTRGYNIQDAKIQAENKYFR